MKPIIFLVMSIMLLFMELCPDKDPGTFFTEEDIALIARVIMSEASNQPFEAKQAVGAALVNRVFSPDFPNTVQEVIKGQFSTQDNGEPTEECYLAAEAAILFRDAFPQDMYWFRDTHYHTFAYPYVSIGKMYFSTKYDYRTNPEWVYAEE